MSDIERLRAWLKTFPGASSLEGMQVDFTDQIPGNFGIFPSGMQEISKTEFIDGEVILNNQYNFALYTVFSKAPGDDAGALLNADWVMDFQKWVQSQSTTGAAPKFGNVDQDEETIKAQNGTLYDADAEGLAMYMVQLTASFHYHYDWEE